MFSMFGASAQSRPAADRPVAVRHALSNGFSSAPFANGCASLIEDALMVHDVDPDRATDPGYIRQAKATGQIDRARIRRRRAPGQTDRRDVK